MIRETELKLHIDAEHLALLRRHPFLRALSVTRARTARLYSVYYDTPDLDLHRRAMALRLRRTGSCWVQTLKGGGQASAGLHQRNEWEVPAAAGHLDLEALAARGGVVPHAARDRLQPLFITDFSRTTRLLDFEGARIELAMDSGEVRGGHSSCPISELELELKSGSPLSLFRLALVLLDIVPLRVEHSSKAEYGYRLSVPGNPAPVKGSLPPLHGVQPARGALRGLIAACLAQVQTNIPGALRGEDEEYLHQVRVGLRRLRVMLAMVRRFGDDAELVALREKVAHLCVELGYAREWDVFVTQTLASLATRFPEHAGVHKLIQAGEKQRKARHAGTVASLYSPDFQRLLLRLGAWLQGGQWDEPCIPFKPFVIDILERQHRRVRAGGVALRGQPAELHRLRIACKKLRYSTEIFGAMLADAECKSYLTRLAAVQDALGALHDIAVAGLLLCELDNRQRRATLVLVRGWIEHDQVEHLARFDRVWRKFVKADRCWIG